MHNRCPRKSFNSSSDEMSTNPDRTKDNAASANEEPRPSTACLEAPLVLDPRLVDKLDMTMLNKVMEFYFTHNTFSKDSWKGE